MPWTNVRYNTAIFTLKNKACLRFDGICGKRFDILRYFYINVHCSSFHLSFVWRFLHIEFSCYKFSNLVKKLVFWWVSAPFFLKTWHDKSFCGFGFRTEKTLENYSVFLDRVKNIKFSRSVNYCSRSKYCVRAPIVALVFIYYWVYHFWVPLTL